MTADPAYGYVALIWICLGVWYFWALGRIGKP